MPCPSMALKSEIADPSLKGFDICNNFIWKFELFPFKLQSFRQKQMKFDIIIISIISIKLVKWDGKNLHLLPKTVKFRMGALAGTN
jgi:hypothetical protein